jgi:fermentation-respiration switch protein FrsA (DUF1100 family)
MLQIVLKWLLPVGIILALVLSFFLFYPWIENFFVFFPQTSFDSKPENWHLDYEDAYFTTEDGIKLHGWFFPLAVDRPAILFCHGNAGNISHRLDNVARLLEKGLQVFIFDYRGYGRSAGKPSEKGIYLDGLAAYDYLVREERIPASNIVVFGRSLGAAVAIEVALQKEIRSVILESAFTSTKDMAKAMLLFKPLSPFMPVNYDNLAKISRLRTPKLIVHGDQDEIVPFGMGQKLFDAADRPKDFYPIRGAGHNDTYPVGGEKYFNRVATFVEDLGT